MSLISFCVCVCVCVCVVVLKLTESEDIEQALNCTNAARCTTIYTRVWHGLY